MTLIRNRKKVANLKMRNVNFAQVPSKRNKYTFCFQYPWQTGLLCPLYRFFFHVCLLTGYVYTLDISIYY